MRFAPRGLGPKLNLSLIVFMLVLGAAAAALLLVGFERTQGEATDRSRSGLEAQSRRVLHEIATQSSTIGQMLVARGMDDSAHGARYMRDASAYGVTREADVTGLQAAEGGQWFDPNPARVTDVWIPASTEVDAEIERELRDSAALDALFPTLLSRSTDAVAMYYTSPSGFTRYYPPIGLERRLGPDIAPGVRDRIRRAGPLENPGRRTILTAPFQDPAGQGELLAAQTPVYIDGEFRGIIGVDLSLARIVGQADSIHLTPSGFAFVLDAQGELLHGASYELVSAALDDPSNEQLARTISGMRRGETGVDRVTLAGREYFIGYAPLRNIGASLAITAPIDEITAEAGDVADSIEEEGNRTVALTLGLLATFFVAALVGTAWLSRRLLLRPIEALVAGTRAISAGDLGAQIDVRSQDELGTLARSFNRMTDDIRERTNALRERELQYRSVFESTSDGLMISNLEGELVETNDAACAMHGYTREEFLLLPPGGWVHPDYRRKRIEYLRSVKVGKPARIRSVDVRRDGSTFPVEALGTAFTYRGDPHILTVLRDITDQVRTEEVLEQRVEARTRELKALLDVARDVASTLELESVLRVILEQVRVVVPYWRAAFMTREGEALVIRAVLEDHDEGAPGLGEQLGYRFHTGDHFPMWRVLSEGRPVVIDDVRSEHPLALEYRRAIGSMAETTFSKVRGWMAVPTIRQGRVVGMLALASPQPGFFTGHHAELLMAIASQAAVAIENARLYEESAERTRELSALLETSRSVATTLDLGELLGLIIERLRDVVDYAGCSIVTRDGDDMVILGARGPLSRHEPEAVGLRFSIEAIPAWWDNLGRGDAVIVADVQGDTEDAQQYRAVLGDRIESPAFRYIRSWMAVPLALKDRVIGFLSVSQDRPDYFTPRHARLVRAFADQAAVAIENARLFEQAQHFAAVEERQRLARELHDSVSQALYGIALGARTARTQLDRDATRAVEPIEYVLSLAEAGLAEMRALIFELRPESLETEGLVAALEKQIAATQARYGVQVEARLGPEPDVPLDQKETVYRIAQEAMHNVVKHARASRIDLLLECDGELRLEVRDDGIGFNTGDSFPGHIGLQSMRERVARIGGGIEITSAPGEGTRIAVRIPQRAAAATAP
jgi:PAS domain S-box-containing protein